MDCWTNKQSIVCDQTHSQGTIPIVPLELNKQPPIDNEGDWNQQFLQTPSTTVQPDLPGITKMLRMINPEQITGEKLNCTTNGAVIISKLNQNAPEFIPRNTLSNTIYAQRYIETNPNCDINNKLELNKVNDNDKKKMLKALVSKIGTSHVICERTRRERNAAIAGILKLGTQPIDNVKPVTSNENEDTTETPTKEVLKKSIERVDRWLNSAQETQKKTNTLYLGPITFKRKAKSTESSISINTVSSEETKINNFSPTNIANDLTETYTNRIKQREDPPLDIWSKLERDLKMRDEEITKKPSSSSL